jgi:hypothetical protein
VEGGGGKRLYLVLVSGGRSQPETLLTVNPDVCVSRQSEEARLLGEELQVCLSLCKGITALINSCAPRKASPAPRRFVGRLTARTTQRGAFDVNQCFL